jgi:RNA polymerase sigma-70 factor (ECF subfamily)
LVDQRRARVLLTKLLEEIPMDLRTVFILFELEQMSRTEVARVLDLPAGTVASRLRKAREIFEQKLAEAEEGRS